MRATLNFIRRIWYWTFRHCDVAFKSNQYFSNSRGISGGVPNGTKISVGIFLGVADQGIRVVWMGNAVALIILGLGFPAMSGNRILVPASERLDSESN